MYMYICVLVMFVFVYSAGWLAVSISLPHQLALSFNLVHKNILLLPRRLYFGYSLATAAFGHLVFWYSVPAAFNKLCIVL